MEVRAQARYVRVSPRKARIVVDLVRGKSVAAGAGDSALHQSRYRRDRGRGLNSAVANAEHNNHLRAESLVVKKAYVDEGPTMKRIRPRAKGSAARIRKRTSHITIVVAPREEA